MTTSPGFDWASFGKATGEQARMLASWQTAVTNLARFTQSATQGDAGKIPSAGFGVANPRVPLPVPELVAMMGLTVALNGTPGHSKISWNGVPGADGYLVQGSGPDHADDLADAADRDEASVRCERGDGGGKSIGTGWRRSMARARGRGVR